MRKHAVLHAAIALVLALFPVSNSAAAEDLTTFDEHFEKNRRMTPIGPLGILTRFLTPQSLRVDEIIVGSPADGVLEMEDVIVAANGKTFEGEPVGPYPALLMKLAEQIEESQGNPALDGEFSLSVIREGKELTIDFQPPTHPGLSARCGALTKMEIPLRNPASAENHPSNARMR